MNAKEKVIERIRLLLNLGRSPNPNEAESAVAMAAKLMDDYRISKEEVDRAGARIQSVDVGPLRYFVEHRVVVRLLEGYFNVTTLWSRVGRMRTIHIYGDPADLEVALQVYRTLLMVFKQRWDRCKRKCSDRVGFMYGIKEGVARQCQCQRDERPVAEQNALVVIQRSNREAVIDFIKQHEGGIGKPRPEKRDRVSSEAYCLGYAEGLTVKIFDQVPKECSLLAPNS